MAKRQGKKTERMTIPIAPIFDVFDIIEGVAAVAKERGYDFDPTGAKAVVVEKMAQGQEAQKAPAKKRVKRVQKKQGKKRES